MSDALETAQALLSQRDLSSAIEAFTRAERNGADADECAGGRWFASMLAGDFEGAWCESDAIRGRGKPDPNRFWNGESIRGKRVMLRCLHGLGDAVQYLRYLPMLRAEAAEVIVEVPPLLLELAPCFDGAPERIISWGPHAPRVVPAWDVQIEIAELPYFFRTQPEDLPIGTHYIRVPPQALRDAKPRPHRAESLRIGFVWTSGAWSPSRSVPIEVLESVTRVPGCEFWNLQGAPAHGEWSRLADPSNLHDRHVHAGNLLEFAALVAQLDLVITSDTMAAHLAGALGVPAWVMLEEAADWRWQHGRSDSPWYPSLRLFRQPAPGDWSSVVAQICAQLQKRIRAGTQQVA